MSSTRLPGKAMLPLDGVALLRRLIRRIQPSQRTDEVAVVTSENRSDDIIEHTARQEDASVYRGSETDVLGRIRSAAESTEADVVVRVCADNPLVSYRLVDNCINTLRAGIHDFVSTKVERTFPLGYDAEVFTMESFRQVDCESTKQNEREHVTVYYRENPDEFSRAAVLSEEMFADENAVDRTELRLTLDEADDYRLIDEVYTGTQAKGQLLIEDAVEYIDSEGLSGMNSKVDQKTMYDAE